MASGTITLNSNRWNLEGRINWSSTSNGSSSNTSNVWAELQVRRNDGYTTTGTWNGALNIGGTEQSFSIHMSLSTSWVTVKSFTKSNVAHNDNGTGTCWISGYCNGPSGTSMAGATVSGNQTVTLDTIPRYLSITGFSIQTRQINRVVVKWSTSDPRDNTSYSLNGGSWVGSSTYGENVASDTKSGTFNIDNLNPNTTYRLKIRCKRTDSQLWTESNEITFTTYDYAKLNSVPNVNIGSSQKITWSNPNSASTSLKLCKTNNSQIINYGTVTGTSKTVTPTASTIYALTPNSNTYKARYIITTTQNGKTYTNSKDFTFSVTNSNPTFNNFTYVDSNSNTVALTGNNQHIIAKHSSVRATISTANKATAKNSATMKTYRLSIGTKTKDANYSSNAAVNIELTNIDNNTIIVYAIDSRNNSTSKSVTAAKYITYQDINIKNITLTRSDGGVGQQVTLKYDGYIWNGNFGTKNNSIKSIKYQYKRTNSSTWIDGATILNPTLSGNAYSQTIEIQGDLAGKGFSRENTYDFRIIINDELSSATKSVIMTSGIPLYAYAKNGIAILGPYDDAIKAALQVYGKTYTTQGMTVKTLANGAGTSGYMHACKITVDSTYQNQDIIFKIIQRNRSGEIILRFTATNSKDPNISLFAKTGNIQAYIVKNTTSIWNLYIQKSEGYDNIEVVELSKGAYMYNTEITWINNTVTSLPSGYKTASTYMTKSLSSKTHSGWGTNNSYYPDMSFIAYWNGAYDSGNQSNLTYCNQGEIQAKPISLYNNSSGTTGTVTLSQSVANFTYIEVYYKDDWNYCGMTKVYSANGKTALLVSNRISSSDGAFIKSRNVKLSGTQIITEYNGNWASWNNSVSDTKTYISIYKVNGYK